jgi:hypothetical protein
MVNRKAEPNRRMKPAEGSAAAGRRSDPRRNLKNDGGCGLAPGDRGRRECLTLDCEFVTLEELPERLPNTRPLCKLQKQMIFRLPKFDPSRILGRGGRR